MKIKTTRQWQDKRESILAGIVRSGIERRYHFEDISEITNWQVKQDGRYWTWYWIGDIKHTIYRYQWRWIKANGIIPEGYVVHHVNECRNDDDLDNLELLANSIHAKLHGAIAHIKSQLIMSEWTCQNCGVVFKMYKRENRQVRKYCSAECHHQSQKHDARIIGFKEYVA